MISTSVNGKIIIEGLEIAEFSTIAEAVGLLFASHYVLNLKFCHSFRHTLAYIQKHIFNFREKKATASKVTFLARAINNSIGLQQ